MDLERNIREDQGYSARGVVAKINKIGDIQTDFMFTPVYEYITLDCGKGNRPQCVKFVSPAPRVQDEFGNEFLDVAALKPGSFIIAPGLLYEITGFTSALYTEHLKALRTYVPKDITIAEAPDAAEESIDLGSLNMAEDSDTKSAIQDHLVSQTKH